MGNAYSAPALTSTGGVAPVTWAVSSGNLPFGLTLNSSTGVISGTPVSASTSIFTVTATDSTTPLPQSASARLSITVNPAGLIVTTTSVPAAEVGSPYAGATLMSTGGTAPVSWSVSHGKLPKGLSLDSGTGDISGTPTAAGSSTFTVTATDSSTPKAGDGQIQPDHRGNRSAGRRSHQPARGTRRHGIPGDDPGFDRRHRPGELVGHLGQPPGRPEPQCSHRVPSRIRRVGPVR